jgi:hypothetical protein
MLNPFQRLRYKINPEKAIDLKRQEEIKHQNFYNISRESRILAAREITEQVYAKEAEGSKLSEKDIELYAMQKANQSVSHNERACHEVANMVLKLYHLGLQIPDHQL